MTPEEKAAADLLGQVGALRCLVYAVFENLSPAQRARVVEHMHNVAVESHTLLDEKTPPVYKHLFGVALEGINADLAGLNRQISTPIR